jgi:Protein of unknown function (DUF2778)
MLREPTNAGSRKEASVRTATVENESSFESRFILASSTAPGSSFDERFSGRSAPPSRTLRSTISFEDRFAAAAPPVDVASPVMSATVGLAPASDPTFAPPPAPRVAAAAPAPQPVTRSIAPSAPKQPAGYRVASLSETPVPTAYASTEGPTKDASITDLLKKMSLRGSTDAAPHDAARQDAALPSAPNVAPRDPTNPLGNDAGRTAVYDISAHIVYMPNGDRLEAHSGLGEYMDDVHSVNLKHYGPTPPNVYELRMREASFHGVQAIRLNPVDGSQMYGRDGILAHPFMLGPNGQSNGCVSFKDYDAFLKAFQRGEVTKMVVVEHLDDTGARTASDWLSNTLKGIFGRS